MSPMPKPTFSLKLKRSSATAGWDCVRVEVACVTVGTPYYCMVALSYLRWRQKSRVIWISGFWGGERRQGGWKQKSRLSVGFFEYSREPARWGGGQRV